MRIMTQNLGFPRIGRDRELKKAVEAYWKDPRGRSGLLATASSIRQRNWRLQKAAGIDLIPSNDFSFYDQMLDHICLLGCAPSRYTENGRRVANLDEYFAMARGSGDLHALEMTKWLDTNYHYLVPELEADQDFQLASTKPFDEFREALGLGILTKPVLPGPLSFLRLAKCGGKAFDKLSLLPKLLPVYRLILRELRQLGAEWVQFDEPILAMDMEPEERAALLSAYRDLTGAAPGLSLMVCAYFGPYGENLATLLELPVKALHIDTFRAGDDCDALLQGLSPDTMLSLGVVDGRNVWKNDFSKSLKRIAKAREKIGADRLILSPSCSLLHVPISLAQEKPTPLELLPWLSFAEEKLSELGVLARLAQAGNWLSSPEFRANQEAVHDRRDHPAANLAGVRGRVMRLHPEQETRKSPYADRKSGQSARLGLPLYPTTTIGSFPQTEAVRRARANWKKGGATDAEYRSFLEAETLQAIRRQEELGLDVLVHGEFERNDMVEFFGEKLAGFAFTSGGWVQSYGTRCVKPPIIYGDVHRTGPMTLDWAAFAMKATDRPMKGMLTGPVTILKWSFVRDDQPLSETADQIALAIRDEVADLEAAGIPIIQIDEPALREALPLRKSDWKACLDWEVRAFKLASSGVKDETQIHTHMCYCDFGEIMEYIARMDADVISLEASRSRMELLGTFSHFAYPNGIGPGVWDIHSPRIPGPEEMAELLLRARGVLGAENLWINPDCGLKTRGWEEVLPALRNMVEAARSLREKTQAT
ncbi:MAG: 5-methyltetrahydropteroyltriglutamate--homocysteine S-methyltransferase [Fibrobacteres bacterium]|nr:5-methyltetrahydropteroyltriglutamate--homocysteine S-methyltransferase [Fibrobacterota bacterium]